MPRAKKRARSAKGKTAGRKRHEAAGSTPDAEHLTDLGNARRLVAEHRNDLRYVTKWRRWLVWDGQRWRPDETDEIERRAKATVRALHVTVSRIVDDTQRRAFGAHAVKSENGNRIAEMIKLARSEPGISITPNQLDADIWKLNVANGTLDLRTGTLLPHGRERLITKLAPVRYDPGAPGDLWIGFLNRVLGGDESLLRYVQRVVGYAMTGDTSEQCLFMLYGAGANGKSTLLNTVRAMLGGYALHTPTETLLVKHGDSISNDVARLHGARFVTAIEAEGGKRLAEARVKQLTGGDPVAARFLYGEHFEFHPVFKLFLAVNHKPPIRGTDHAIWRRIRLIPFDATISDTEKDPQLPEKLRAELPGILRWAVEGCLAWQKEGLGTPEIVTKATNEYRGEMDLLAAFITQRCVKGPAASTPARDLYAAYSGWCEQRGDFKLHTVEFGKRLGEMGFTPGRSAQERHWQGLRLVTDDG